MKKSLDTIDIPDPIESFRSKQSQDEPIDYRLLKNKSNWINYAIFDFWWTAWAVGDATYREVNIWWINGDMQATYTAYTLLTGLWTMDYKLTRVAKWVKITGNNITLPAGKTCRIQMYFNSATMLGRITTTGGSFRYLQWGTLDFSNTNQTCTFINASTSDATFVIKYGTSAANRPIFWVSIEIF